MRTDGLHDFPTPQLFFFFFLFKKQKSLKTLPASMPVTPTGLSSGTQQVNTSDELRVYIPRAT